MRVAVEMTRSRSGRHASRRLLIVFRGGRTEVISAPEERRPDLKTYARGLAGEVEIPKDAEVAVYVSLVRNPRGHVKGYFDVLSPQGQLLLRMKLVRRKLRRVEGSEQYGEYIERALKLLKLDSYIRRINYGTGALGK